MAVRTDGVVTLPTFFLRLFQAPAALGASIATVAEFLRRRARQPSLARMSEDWLRNHSVDDRRDLP